MKDNSIMKFITSTTLSKYVAKNFFSKEIVQIKTKKIDDKIYYKEILEILIKM